MFAAPHVPSTRIASTICIAALALAGNPAGAQTLLDRAVEARGRGAIFEALDLLRGAAPSVEARIEQAINAYHLGRFDQARETLGAALAEPGITQAQQRRAITWVVRINREQLERMAAKPFEANLAFGIGGDSNANNALDPAVLDTLDALPAIASRQPRGDAYGFYRVSAGHEFRPAAPANWGGHPLTYGWTNTASRYVRNFSEVADWSADYTRLASDFQFRKHMRWVGGVRLSALDYRLDGERLARFGSAEMSYRRLTRPWNIGARTSLQRLDYRQAGWSEGTGYRARIQGFVQSAVAARHFFRVGVEPQWFRADGESPSYRGVRLHVLHAWQGSAWSVSSGMIYEKNQFEATQAGNIRREDRLRFTVNLVRPLSEQLYLSLTAQHFGSDSSLKSRNLSKNQLELSFQLRL